jgi:hypothetical protein
VAAIADELVRVTRAILVEVFGAKPDANHGYGKSEVAAAERKLGAPLPAVLRAYYATAGEHPACRKALHRLVPVTRLRRDARGLVFLREQQGVAFYAILAEDLGRDDPPAFIGQPDRDDWALDAERLAPFLVKNLCWQAMERMWCRQASLSRDSWSRAVASLAPVECGAPMSYSAEVHRDGGLVVCGFGRDGQVHVHAACRDRERLDGFIAGLRR